MKIAGIITFVFGLVGLVASVIPSFSVEPLVVGLLFVFVGYKLFKADPQNNVINSFFKSSFWKKTNEYHKEVSLQKSVKAEERSRAIAEQKQQENARIAQLDRDGIAYCPRCYSTSLSANKKGFGIGKAVVGGIAGVATGGTLGLVGLAAGNIGAKKVKVTCLKCGHQFWAGKR